MRRIVIAFNLSCQKTIDLRHHSTFDELVEHDKDVDSQTIFAAEQLETFDHAAEMEQTTEKTSINRVKVCNHQLSVSC